MTPDPTVPPSDHATLQAAVDALCQQLPDYQPAVELAKQKRPALPGGRRCLAHFSDEPCSTCAAYIAAGL